MNITRRTSIVMLVGAIPAFACTSAFAAGSTVHVSLWDKGENSMDLLGKAKPMGMAMAGSEMSMATMGIKLDTTEVPAGEVTFKVVNDAKNIIHEMVLSSVADPGTALPYVAADEKVNEDAAGHLGEVAELEPGKSGALTLTLKPGTYILYCNIPGHYVLGMWTMLTVKG